MAILIVVALVVIVVTIYSRLSAMESNQEARSTTITLPDGAHISGASLGDKGQILLFIEHNNRQELWHMDAAGRLQHKIETTTKQP